MTFKDFVDKQIIPIGNTLLGILFAFAFLFFIFGVFRFFFLKSDPASQEQGRAFMLWGLVALVVLFSVWGLVNLVLGLLPRV